LSPKQSTLNYPKLGDKVNGLSRRKSLNNNDLRLAMASFWHGSCNCIFRADYPSFYGNLEISALATTDDELSVCYPIEHGEAALIRAR
jgi:hypothetical protein